MTIQPLTSEDARLLTRVWATYPGRDKITKEQDDRIVDYLLAIERGAAEPRADERVSLDSLFKRVEDAVESVPWEELAVKLFSKSLRKR